MADYHRGRCYGCGRGRQLVKMRRSGYVRCDACHKQAQSYGTHWFVRSLAYKPPRLKAMRPRKPLPGQLKLF